MDAIRLTADDSSTPDPQPGSGVEGWRKRAEERRSTRIAAKAIRASGACLAVTITDVSASGLRLEGADGLTIGENILILLPDSSVIEVTIRWAFNDDAGARIVD